MDSTAKLDVAVGRDDRKQPKMSGQKRDYNGKAKEAPKVVVARNEFTPVFEWFRDELDEHHDRRERIVKASRDITALSKKIVRKINQNFPSNIEAEIKTRLADISVLLASIAPEVQGINRYRYARNMSCIEELIEALTFAHYLRTQSLMGYEESVDKVAALYKSPDQMEVENAEDAAPPPVLVTEQDYLMGIFDLSGEMMRFATTSAALNGSLDGPGERTIVADMQELGSVFEILPQQYGKPYAMKLDTLRQSVLKVEKLGYGLKVRGSERPAGWMPDTNDDGFRGEE
ncbi:hypothetical protein N0V82_004463 [Gnomoniopsis sp. IMI 355080]|nr:hypothetical protein N0V82_004463 [Gnomoniopsis sp. IMI 355080]